MSTTPAEKMEPIRDNSDGRISVWAPPANHSRDGEDAASPWETAHESETLRAVSLYAARLDRPLRSGSRTSRVCEVRRRAGDAHQPLPTRDPQEAKMGNSPQHLQQFAAKRCAVCDGKFGLIRHYSWRAALCSRKCADRLKVRRDADRRWLRCLQAA